MSDFNTRRFPRTMDEAFPHGAAYGCAIERPANHVEKLLDMALAVAIGVGLAAALVAWWSS